MNCVGVSLLTQLLYVLVFCTRYLDLFWVPPNHSWWNFLAKNFYIWSSVYIIYIMLRVFARTREREKAWKLAAYALGGTVVATPIVGLIFEGAYIWRFTEFLWVFSIILESVCVLPQLLLLRQTTVPTVIDSGYLITLGSYRLLYIFNWIWKAIKSQQPEPVAVVFGVLQTALYVDFAWVYWTRQRVKLRGGGVVDSDDLRKGFLVHRALDHTTGRESLEDAEAQDGAAAGEQPGQQSRNSRWGARGVSIAADDTLDQHHSKKDRSAANGAASESTGMFEDADDDDDFMHDNDDDAPALDGPENQVLNSNAQWRDDDGAK